MSVEPLETAIRLWQADSISVEQAIGKVLLWLKEHQKRLLKLETAQRRFDNEVQRNKGK